MRKSTVLCTLVLAASAVFFGMYNWKYLRNQDTLGPIIEMDSSEIYVSVNDPQSQLFSGMTAMDSKDGDVTSSLLVEHLSDFIAEDTRQVSYAAFDTDNHVAKATRKLIYTDYVPVVFTLDKPLRFAAASGKIDYLSPLHARDCIDGDVSDLVTFTSDSVVNAKIASDYKVTLEVTNSAGETFRLPVTITLYDSYLEKDAPTIELTNYLIYIGKGETIDPMEYLKDVIYRGTQYALTDEEGTFAVDTTGWGSYSLKEFRERDPMVNRDLFKITNLVNSAIPGTYEVEYTLEDLEGNKGRVLLIVVVEDEA